MPVTQRKASGARRPQPFPPAVEPVSRLLKLHRLLRNHLPGNWRAAEASVDDNGRLGLLACLPAEVSVPQFRSLLSAAGLAGPRCVQAAQVHGIRCWRHNVRICEDGRLGLYIERDFSPALLLHILHLCGAEDRLAEVALTCCSASVFKFWAVGVEWGPNGAARCRFYLVAPSPAREQWPALMAWVRAWFPWLSKDQVTLLGRLLRVPRRACLLNLQSHDGYVAVKVEVPEVPVRSLRSILHTDDRPTEFRQLVTRWRVRRFRHLGVRFFPNGGWEPLYYIPWPSTER